MLWTPKEKGLKPLDTCDQQNCIFFGISLTAVYWDFCKFFLTVGLGQKEEDNIPVYEKHWIFI